MNCSTGPEAMLEPIAKMAEYAAIPLLAKPNAGMPELIDGQTVFNVEPEEFAEVGKNWSKGCCHHWTIATQISPFARSLMYWDEWK